MLIDERCGLIEHGIDMAHGLYMSFECSKLGVCLELANDHKRGASNAVFDFCCIRVQRYGREYDVLLQNFGIDQWGYQWAVYQSCLCSDAILWPRPMSSNAIDAIPDSDPKTKLLRWLGLHQT
jgi:hypothetical protein